MPTYSTTGVTTTLNGAIGAGDAQIRLAASHALPTARNTVIRIDSEDIRIDNLSGDLAQVERGFNGTTRAAHNNGATVTMLSEDTGAGRALDYTGRDRRDSNDLDTLFNPDTGEMNMPGAASVAGLLTLLKGLRLTPTARTATADGLTTGTIAADETFITVTSGDVNHIITLPAPTPGRVVILGNGGTGYELRSSAPATVAINGGAASNAESAIPANALVIAVCQHATSWKALQIAAAGTVAGVEAAA